MRYFLPLLLLALFVPTVAAQPPAAPAAGAPAVDVQRLQLEEKLKEYQRREKFEHLDPKTLQSVLTNIIDLCIELGRDCPTEEKKLEEVESQMDKADQAAQLAARRDARVKQLKARAYDALVSSPPAWFDARQYASQALRLAPKDPEADALKTRAERGLRDALIYRTVVGVFGAVGGLAALIAGVKWLRNRDGVRVAQLTMLKGPLPGDVFMLEKETTALGASANEADWAIPDPGRLISRRHCEISRSGRHYFLTDCSSNGTEINGKPAPKGEPVLLRKGDVIALAEDVVVKFR